MPRWIPLLTALIVALCMMAPTARAQSADWNEIAGGDPASDMIALTFDAGSAAGWMTTAILDTLRDRGIKQTFFLTGAWVESYPEFAQRVAEDGHEISNHTYHHPDLTLMSGADVQWQLSYTEDIIKSYTSHSSKPWFRPPFGARNSRVLNIAQEAGFRSIYWTLDSGDWRTNATAASVSAKVLNNASGGDIVVMHVYAEPTGTALGSIIDVLQARGLRLVTVSDLVEKSARLQ